ncbi:MAG: pyrroline-5-carboxylate reductase, partial [Candidatus Altiarchaeota archaeon]|nr:pyrroline-5-carboxylate reductase [Candidatus Altiarchaeota archaeon]
MARVGFIGVGRMGQALISGFLSKGLIKKEEILAYDLDMNKPKKMGLATKYSAFEVVENSDIVFLCVKPKDFDIVLSEIRDICGSRLVVSVAAGITTSYMESFLHEARVIRVMPNTPATIYELAGAYCLGSRASEEDSVFVGGLLNSIGVAYQVSEELMDAVTGLSGSGPAYIYYIIKALTDAGVKQGLTDEASINLVLQTIRGAVDMVIVTKKDPTELI